MAVEVHGKAASAPQGSPGQREDGYGTASAPSPQESTSTRGRSRDSKGRDVQKLKSDPAKLDSFRVDESHTSKNRMYFPNTARLISLQPSALYAFSAFLAACKCFIPYHAFPLER